MNLRLRFNLVLAAVFLIGFLAASVVANRVLHTIAQEDSYREAALMIEVARGIRGYTTEFIQPHLREKMDEVFMPQSVPAFAASNILQKLSDQFGNYTYKEAVINPTNLRDRTLDWEADIVRAFGNEPQDKLITGRRETTMGASLYAARPIIIKSEACLSCHGTAADAPPTMVALYGNTNGFGWKVGEVIGAQIVSVPESAALQYVSKVYLTFVGAIGVVFVLLFIALNIMLTRLVIRPITAMANDATTISEGDFSLPEFQENRPDEIGSLAHAFNRMRRSLEQAMSMMRD